MIFLFKSTYHEMHRINPNQIISFDDMNTRRGFRRVVALEDAKAVTIWTFYYFSSKNY